MQSNKRFLIAIAVIGIFIELAAVGLMAAKAIPVALGVPIIIVGMFLAMIPMFALSRMRRNR